MCFEEFKDKLYIFIIYKWVKIAFNTHLSANLLLLLLLNAVNELEMQWSDLSTYDGIVYPCQILFPLISVGLIKLADTITNNTDNEPIITKALLFPEKNRNLKSQWHVIKRLFRSSTSELCSVRLFHPQQSTTALQ